MTFRSGRVDRRTVVTRDHVGSIPTSGAGTKGDRCPWSSARSSDTREGLVRLQGPPLDARSSNGRTPGSDPGNRGSKPCLAVITAPSANGQAAGFSVRRSEFKSPWCHHLRDVAQLAARAVRDREAARSNRAIPTLKSRKPPRPASDVFLAARSVCTREDTVRLRTEALVSSGGHPIAGRGSAARGRSGLAYAGDRASNRPGRIPRATRRWRCADVPGNSDE